MHPLERLKTVANGGVPDRVPVDLGFSFKRYPAYLQQWASTTGKEVGRDPESKLQARWEFYRDQYPGVVPELERPVGTGPVGLFSLLDERKVKTSDSMPPSLHLDETEFAEMVDDGKVIRDPYEDEWMRGALDEWRSYVDAMPAEAREEYGGTAYTLSAVCPLFAIGAFLSFEKIFSLMYDDPDVLHDAMRFHTDNLVSWVEAVEGVFLSEGLEPPKFQVPTEILPMLSPNHGREFCRPYYRELFEASQSSIRVFHCDNHVTPMADLVADLGANVYRGNFCDYAELREKLSDEVALMGNVPPLRVLTNGDPADVEECCRWLIGECAPEGGFVLSAGGSFDLRGRTPFENIDAMVDSAEKYGEYPITVEPGSRPSVYESFVTSSFPLKPDARTATGNGSGNNTGTELPEFADVAAYTRDGDVQAVRRLVRAHLDDGAPREDVWEALRAGLGDAEARFWNEEYYYPEILQADRAYRAGIAEFDSPDDLYRGTAVIGALRSIFESGNIVVEAILHGAGLRVVDLGANVSPEEFVDEADRLDADVIAMGVYMPRNPPHVAKVARLLRERELDVQTVAGGVGVGYPPPDEPLDVDALVVDCSTLRGRVEAMVAG